MRGPELLVAERFESLDALPACAESLFEAAPFQLSRAWWRCVVAAALPADARPCFVLCRRGARAVALVALKRGPGRRLGALSTPYTTVWAPLLAADADEATVMAAAAAFARACRPWPVMRWDSLDPEWPPLPAWRRGLRAAGLFSARYDHYGNWHEPTTGVSWREYLEARPGAPRNTIRRKFPRAERDPRLRFGLARTATPAALEAYRAVYRRSWKQAEPFPDFDAALLDAAGVAGVLRLGLLFHDDLPVAAQYWIVSDRVATVLKLAHDEAFRARSPGTLLTAWMVRHLLDQERVDGLDFGRGDDAYKRDWTSRRRQRIGLVIANPWRPSGALALARQALAAARGRPRAHPV